MIGRIPSLVGIALAVSLTANAVWGQHASEIPGNERVPIYCTSVDDAAMYASLLFDDEDPSLEEYGCGVFPFEAFGKLTKIAAVMGTPWAVYKVEFENGIEVLTVK